MPFTVEIKHAGKQHKVDFNPVGDAKAFKESIYQVTGVPVDRMKVMVKGGILKDDADLSKLAVKEGQLITVIGTAGPLPEAPAAKITFLEDMDDSDLAGLNQQPPGLTNLGNTCYMNASLQALRSIPELQTALDAYKPPVSNPFSDTEGQDARLTNQLKLLYKGMGSTTQAVPPFAFLNTLRQVSPQFAEQGPQGGYLQQDADEMWIKTLASLNNSLKTVSGDSSSRGSFIEDHFALDLQQTMKCDEAPEETQTVKIDKAFKLDCNINSSTNYMMAGIKESFDQKIEKTSETLGRTAVYTQTSRLARLPENLTVHMVRFYWRADTRQKAKIMRKVKFPIELDVSELLTDDLKAKFRPVNMALKNIDKARVDRAKLRKKQKNNISRAAPSAGSTSASIETLEAGPSTVAAPTEETGEAMQTDPVSEEDERKKEREQVKELIRAQGGGVEKGSNQSGLYELCAIVTHKGSTAESGHYIGWTRQPTDENGIPGEEDWWKFDDDKVSTVPMSKITSLDGGGEDSTAYILLYRTKRV